MQQMIHISNRLVVKAYKDFTVFMRIEETEIRTSRGFRRLFEDYKLISPRTRISSRLRTCVDVNNEAGNNLLKPVVSELKAIQGLQHGREYVK